MLQTQLTREKGASRKEQVIATLLGQPSFQEIDWRLLMKQGVLARLCIRRCRFTAKLELNDLGVRVRDERVKQALARTMVLGEKRLLPGPYMTALERVESGARRLLSKCSFKTELGSFLPVSAYTTWRTEIEPFKTRYYSLRDEIIERHASLVEQVLAEYAIVATDTYQRIREASPEALEEDQATFVANYCAQIRALIPGPERIRSSFDFQVTLADGLKQLEEEQADGAGVGPVAAVFPAQLRSQAGDRAFQQAAMERDLLQQAAVERKAVVDSFLSSIVAQMRALIYDVATDVLATLQKRADGKFSPRSLVQLKNLTRQIALLNFYGDEEIERILAQVQRVIDLTPNQRQRSLGDIAQQLRDIAIVARDTLLDLETRPRAARAVAIPDQPAPEEVRQARAGLGLDLDAQEFLARYETRSERLYRSVDVWDFTGQAGGAPRAPRLA